MTVMGLVPVACFYESSRMQSGGQSMYFVFAVDSGGQIGLSLGRDKYEGGMPKGLWLQMKRR